MALGGRIPILDIAKYHSNRAAFVEELRSACHTVGFFLIRHDFGPLAGSMLDEARTFFARPLEEKLRISYENSPAFRGFMQLGVENTSGRVDYREQVEYAVEYPKIRRKRWPAYERLKATRNPWPTSTRPDLEATTLRYSAAVCAVADAIRDSLCYALQLDPQAALGDKFAVRRAATTAEGSADDGDNGDDVPHWVIKLVSYPPAPVSADGDDGDRRQGVGAHTDTNFLTLVLQDSSSANGYNGGLQAYSQGEWIDVVVPSSSAVDETTESHRKDDESASHSVDSSSSYLICNLGEQAETWSRGYFLATPHRVIARPSTAASSAPARPRTSVLLFYNPALSATMGPLDEGLLRGRAGRLAPPLERPQGYDHWRRPRNTMLPSVGENTFKSLARSHPRVFARHHPDLAITEDGRIVRRAD